MHAVKRAVFAAMLMALLAVGTTAHAGPPLQPRKSKPHEPASNYHKRPEVKAFIDETAKRYGFRRDSLRKLFAGVQAQPSILQAMSRPIEQPPKWYEYKTHLITDERIARGVAYWRDNARGLAEAEREFGIPAEIIVAIVGVETFYGRIPGRFRVIDALTTLAFDYPRRAEFFRKELTEFLLLCREQKLSPLKPRGSFAGAMGLPQFMPGTFRRYAVDFDGDGKIDIWNENEDSIGSVANFLQWHGWQHGGPLLVPAQIDSEEVLLQLNGGLSDRRTVQQWEAEGVRPREPIPHLDAESAAALVMLEEPAVSTYWLGFNNFYVLTRYNRSRLYASAVFELADRIKRARPASASR